MSVLMPSGTITFEPVLRGPKFVRVGKAIRYRRGDVISWMEGKQ
jgi:hypothetical protein